MLSTPYVPHAAVWSDLVVQVRRSACCLCHASRLSCGLLQVMGSAKRPLWLVFKNADPLGQKIILMFKSGDDLRQDTVTLQVW